jgi:sterol 3beta-glucosyltransferase
VRVAIVTYGSEGDVRPYVALGLGLQAAGHSVRLVTHGGYAALAASRGLELAPVGGDPSEVLASAPGSRWVRAGSNPAAFAAGLLRVMRPLMHELARQSLEACRGADAVVASLLGLYAARHVAEKLAVPLVLAPYAPVTPTGAFPSPVLCLAPGAGAAVNRLTHLLSAHLLWQPFRGAVNRLRREVFQLPPLVGAGLAGEVRRQRWPVLNGYSRHVLPRPPEWAEHVEVTGYWFLDAHAGWTPPPALAAFLAAGPPPVYVGFGSMRLPDRPAATRLVLEALARAGRRGVLLASPGGLGGADLPDTAIAVQGCPHDWLFRRVAAAVHHGGAGTTGSALRAGLPSVAVPLFADQPFWGWRLARLGAGPAPIPFRRLTAGRLAAAISAAVEDPAIKARAAHLGRRIRAEDGAARAAEGFERWVGSPRARASPSR